MSLVFEVRDKTGRCIRLTDEQWEHITHDHPEISPYIEDMKEILINPTTITSFDYDEKIKYYYKYFKQRVSPAKYLLTVVKYLNGDGFIITAYFVRKIP